MYECMKCNYSWQPKIKNPKCCPNCKTRSWLKVETKLVNDITIRERMVDHIILFGDIGIKRSEFAARYWQAVGSAWAYWLDELVLSGEIKEKTMQGQDCNGRLTRKTTRYYYPQYFKE